MSRKNREAKNVTSDERLWKGKGNCSDIWNKDW